MEGIGVVVITGARARHRSGAVSRLLDHGTQVVAVDLTMEKLSWLAGVDGVAAVVGDIAAADVNQTMVETAVAKFGRLDGLALNAGIDLNADVGPPVHGGL